MITKKDKDTILQISKKYKIRRVLLFGSSLFPDRESRDIDIGVEGISPEVFFKYYGELLINLSKPIDIIDLSRPSKFVRLITQEGTPLYG
jgi:predicted nucleotidyltransferase